MNVVTDASVVLAWFFEEAHTAKALEVLVRVGRDGLLVPPVWEREVTNGVLIGERRGRKVPAESNAFLALVFALRIETDDVSRPAVSGDVVRLGRRFGLTSYDASYLELAHRQSAILATFDGALRQSARSLKIPVLP